LAVGPGAAKRNRELERKKQSERKTRFQREHVTCNPELPRNFQQKKAYRELCKKVVKVSQRISIVSINFLTVR
jgi:hypothetical protein